eukprot:TCONS_00039721-protein
MNLKIENILTSGITKYGDTSMDEFKNFPINITFDIKIEEMNIGSCNISVVNSNSPVEFLDQENNNFTFKPTRSPFTCTKYTTDIINLDSLVNQKENGISQEIRNESEEETCELLNCGDLSEMSRVKFPQNLEAMQGKKDDDMTSITLEIELDVDLSENSVLNERDDNLKFVCKICKKLCLIEFLDKSNSDNSLI